MNKVIKKYLDYKFSSNQNRRLVTKKDKSDVYFFKLPYIGNLLLSIKNSEFQNFAKSFVKKINTKVVFNLFKIKNYFSNKDPIPNDLISFLVYKFLCASCSSSYIGKTSRHFQTRIEDHIKKDNRFHICKYLQSRGTCFHSYNSLCFKIIDKVDSKFDLKTKEALYINWRKPNLNALQNHLALTLL